MKIDEPEGWDAAVRKALRKKRPAEGWPEPEKPAPKKPRSKQNRKG